jgi:hypothetical protein
VSDSKPPEREEPPAAPESSGLDRHLAPFFEDFALLPVLIVGLAILVTFGAALLLLAVRERNLFAATALLVLLWMSVDVVVRDGRRGRLGLASRFVAGIWLACAAAAGAAVGLGLF